MSIGRFLETRPGRVLLFLGRTIFWTAAALLAFSLCRRGLGVDDEGAMLSSVMSILEGKLPYRDIDMFVTPAAWYLNAAIFALTGPSVIATRIAAAGCLLATMAVTRQIVRNCGSALWGDFAAGLVAIFSVWAWPTWTWSFYSPWATLVSLAALACTLRWIRSRRKTWLIMCGLALGLAIAFKQNYGFFAAVGCGLAIFLNEVAVGASETIHWREATGRTIRHGLLVALGGALVLVPGTLWLAWQGALPAAFDSLLLRPFEGFTHAHTIRYLRIGDLWRQAQIWLVGGLVYMAVPVKATSAMFRWPQPALSLVVVLHVVLYWAPVLAFAGFGMRGLFRLGRDPSEAERALLAITVFAAVYFLGVFPRADFNHLINVYQPVLAMLAAAAAVEFGRGRWRTGMFRKGCTVAAATLLLCFAGAAAIWMNDLRKTLWIPLQAPRAEMLLLEPLEAQMFNDEIKLLQTLTAEDEPVFALPNLSMIPFLAERPMPTRYRNYYAVHIGHDAGLEAAQDIERSEARVVLTFYDNFFSDPTGMLAYGRELATYLRLHFRPVYSIGNKAHMVLLRRDTPLEAHPSQDLWLMCDVSSGGVPSTFLREQLLFKSIYHSYLGAWALENQDITPCYLKVPEDARLKLTVELRQPTAAREPASARAEIWLFPSTGRPRRMFLRDWRLLPEITTVQKIERETEIDLSRWQDQVIGILLRSTIEGPVPEAPFDPFGLSVMWNDARIESPDFADEEATRSAE